MRYTILLHPEEEGGYSVTVPSLEGCVTQGETIGEAVENARDAIEGRLAVMKEHGWEIPVERQPVIAIDLDVQVPETESVHAA